MATPLSKRQSAPAMRVIRGNLGRCLIVASFFVIDNELLFLRVKGVFTQNQNRELIF